jgi:hypothetical protein
MHKSQVERQKMRIIRPKNEDTSTLFIQKTQQDAHYSSEKRG